MSSPRLLALTAAAVLAVLALAIADPERMLSPGALTPGHAGIGTNCFACHAPWRGAAAERCVKCHRLADIGLRTTQGAPLPQQTLKASFHQALIEQDCMACHGDHAGSTFAERSRRPFSHALLRPAARQPCDGCHRSPPDDLHRSAKGYCQLCHSQERWRPATFDHAKRFVLDADHNAPCATCHRSDDIHRTTCYGCHEHRPDRIRARHLGEGIANFENCVRCHRSASEAAEGGDS